MITIFSDDELSRRDLVQHFLTKMTLLLVAIAFITPFIAGGIILWYIMSGEKKTK
ncbi:hypothetical protein [Persicobacter sp. CCB-QB2]|uniref:hypothetical protein n=1 Tax=Persicobacter sp. CCB-QB2 TaxID=1561025 RepID=UPI001C108C06|nr:hypothetical protein [Persicobacter sp. CCB-QB2]